MYKNHKSTIIRDNEGGVWRWSPEKKRVKWEGDNDPFGGYYADTIEKAISILRGLGYIYEDDDEQTSLF